ncbi:hypothetical protein PLICRDRAFT_171509 [Plicaturopsis crispa FD-325 SS-3]|nr:hypothetical protein PLICRDRAFT_171509 [Plicaturopsis crispa FD-325 SS-3]
MPKPCPSNTINDAPYQALAQEAAHSTGVSRPSWHRVNGQAILLRYWAVAFRTYAHDGSVLNLDVGLNCASSTAGVQFCAKGPSVSSSVMLEATSFSFGVRVGLVFMVQAGSVSLIAVMGLLIWLAYGALKGSRRDRTRSKETDVHYYLVSLLMFDIVQATGGLINISWIAKAEVAPGSLCTTQGILLHIGDIGVALSSLIIGIHSFNILVLRWTPKRSTSLVVLGVLWTFIALVVGISYGVHQREGQEFYGNTHYWCWIRNQYSVQQIVLDYLWIWIAAFSNCIIYVLLALVTNDLVILDDGKFRITTHTERLARRGAAKPTRASIARQMLYYPAVYLVTVIPISVARFTEFGGYKVPFAATAFADVLFASSGVLNVILFVLTRPTLLPDRAPDNRLIAPWRPSLSSIARPQLSKSKSKDHVWGQLPDDNEVRDDSDWLPAEVYAENLVSVLA